MSDANDLRTSCEHCGGHISFPQSASGRSVECPHCKKTIFSLCPDEPPEESEFAEKTLTMGVGAASQVKSFVTRAVTVAAQLVSRVKSLKKDESLSVAVKVALISVGILAVLVATGAVFWIIGGDLARIAKDATMQARDFVFAHKYFIAAAVAFWSVAEVVGHYGRKAGASGFFVRVLITSVVLFLVGSLGVFYFCCVFSPSVDGVSNLSLMNLRECGVIAGVDMCLSGLALGIMFMLHLVAKQIQDWILFEQYRDRKQQQEKQSAASK
jgi:uncharacterized paraquat-inducible protein A